MHQRNRQQTKASLLPLTERVFDKFYRGRQNRGRIEGTGMGLAIARTIVESHGGEIQARNDAQGRIVFEFSLPLAPDTVMENVTL